MMDFICRSICGNIDPCQMISTEDTESDIEVDITFCV